MGASPGNLVRRVGPGLIVVFTAENAATARADICLDLDLSELFTPSGDEVAAAEAALPGFLARLVPERPSWDDRPVFWSRLNEYDRQYFGRARAGRRALIGSFFLHEDDPRPDPRGEIVVIFDGGYDVFRVVYDLESAAFVEFTPNGEA